MGLRVKRMKTIYFLTIVLLGFIFLFIFFGYPVNVTSHFSKISNAENSSLLKLDKNDEKTASQTTGRGNAASHKEVMDTTLSPALTSEMQGVLRLGEVGKQALRTNEENSTTLDVNNRKQFNEKLRLFKEILTEREKDEFLRALISFNDAVHLNLTYFLYGGTLLGSYRHHDMIPWDDDLDLLVNGKDKDILQKCLKRLTRKSGFVLDTGINHSWKFYHKNSVLTRKGWRWPFLDIFFYNEDDTYIWDINPNLRKIKFKKTDVFPPVERPFMNMTFHAPRNTSFILSQMFDLETCQSNSYNHREEKWIEGKNVVSIPCDHLRGKFPFVRRIYKSNTTIEILDAVKNETFWGYYTTFIPPV